MKSKLNSAPLPHHAIHALISAILLFPPIASHAQNAKIHSLPGEPSSASLVAIGILLLLSIVMFFAFRRHYATANSEINVLTSELETTRERLTETGYELECAQKNIKATTTRHQEILLDAHVGMFQIDPDGKCTYINTALKEMSGLYPKKAFKEGLDSAIHPDDRPHFQETWEAFVNDGDAFNETFRFQLDKGREVHVACRANKMIGARGEVESYMGWVTDVTAFHERQLRQQAETARYGYFVDETIESHYKLVPETPIPLSSSSSKMADLIMEKMALADCNDIFAAMHGAQPSELAGKAINELQGGCGPFGNKASLQNFVENGYKSSNVESVRQDPNGNRLNLLNNVVGIVEDNKLVGIWGAQRNISLQKREQAAFGNQVRFMHRILNALPGDVHVQDTRCRYLYANKKLTDRTGIAQEEWIGKTIAEVMPDTPKDHDQTAIETMKSGKLNRVERPYEANGKTGWLETVQIPLVSDDGLVEGVVGLSLEVTDRKNKEEEVRQYRINLEKQLKHTREKLGESQADHAKDATALSDAIQKLKIANAEKANREHRFEEHLDERKRIEEMLRRNEEGLKTRQRELEELLAKHLSELDAETDKRKKWEKLLSIKEDELCKAEKLGLDLGRRLEKENELRTKAEIELAALRKELETVGEKLEASAMDHKREIDQLKIEHKTEFGSELRARTRTEKQLERTQDLLQRTQDELQQMNEQHALELEQEVGERKSAAEKLIQSMEELDDLRQRFNERIEEETRNMKTELAQKQIREKALRQNEKDLEGRIRELENMLLLKSKEYTEQIQAREEAEVKKQQIEQRLEQMGKRQQELIARETQKLHLQIAETRLEEVKLRKQVGDLRREKESLEELLSSRSRELEESGRENNRKEAVLAETEARFRQLAENQSKMLAEETEELRKQLALLQQAGEKLREQLGELQQDKQSVEETLETRTTDLSKAAREYRKIVDAYRESQKKIKQFSNDQENLLARKTRDLENELHLLRKTETDQRKQKQHLQKKIEVQQLRIDELLDRLNEETAHRKKTDNELAELRTVFNKKANNAQALVKQEASETGAPADGEKKTGAA